MSSPSIKINSVLKDRKNSLMKAEKVVNYINRLLSYLNKLESITLDLKKHPKTDEIKLEVLNELKYGLPLIYKLLEEELSTWSNLVKRFKRNTINIGVIGRQRQGKSTFLQSVTNLTDKEIPARKGQPCTSVQSAIFHTTENNKAEIIYYSEKEFLNQVIKPYFEKLSTNSEFGLNSMPENLNDLLRLNLKNPTSIKSYDTVAQGWYKSFYNICSNVNHYKKDVLEGSVKLVEASQISKVVQYQYDANDTTIRSYNFVGIKKVIIHCKFNNKNVYRLGLIDLPGLGDTRLGDDVRLIRALGEDVDLILFVKYPTDLSSSWEDVDNELYKAANTILKERLPLDKWAFMVINKNKGNEQMCIELKNRISKIDEVGFVDTLIADVKNPNDSEVILDNLIDYLSKNIEKLDLLLINNCETSLTNLNEEMIKILEISSKLSFITSIESKFDRRFEDFFEELRNVIAEYRKEIMKNRDINKEDFTSEIRKIIKSTKESVVFPTDKKYKRLTNKELTEYQPYHNLIHNMRSHVLRNFHQVTSKQQEKIDEQKREIANLLSSHELLFKLKEESQKNGIEFLEYLKNKIQENPQFSKTGLLEGFLFICKFKISYESSIQEFIYNILVRFFSDKIQTLNSIPDLDKFYAKSHSIIGVKFIDTEVEVDVIEIEEYVKDEVHSEDHFERQKTLSFLKKNAEDLIQICTSIIGFFPGAEMITNVYDIAKSIVNILNSEKEEGVKQSETQSKIMKLEQVITNFEKMGKDEIVYQDAPLENLKKSLFFVLDICEEELIKSLGTSTHRINVSMTKEFFDHIGYTLESKYEWKEFLRLRRDTIWVDFEQDVFLNKKIYEIRSLIDSMREEISILS